MPRIYDSTSGPIDYCITHFPKTEDIAFRLHGHKGDGPDGRGNCFAYDAEHPDYEDDPSMYKCHACRKVLKDKDS